MKPIEKVVWSIALALFAGIGMSLTLFFAGVSRDIIIMTSTLVYGQIGCTTMILLFLLPDPKQKRRRRMHQTKLNPENESVLSIEPVGSGRAG
jgi:hypothetical protein